MVAYRNEGTMVCFLGEPYGSAGHRKFTLTGDTTKLYKPLFTTLARCITAGPVVPAPSAPHVVTRAAVCAIGI